MVAYVLIAVQAVLAVVFAVAAFSKVRSRAAFREFAATVRRFGLVPARASSATAALVVVAEAGAVLLVVVPATTAAGLALAGGLLAVFVAVTLVALRRGLAVPCQCFGASSTTPFGGIQLARNALLLAAVGAGAVAVAAGAGERGGTAALHAGAVAVSLTGAVVVAVLLVSLDELVSLFRAAPRPAGR